MNGIATVSWYNSIMTIKSKCVTGSIPRGINCAARQRDSLTGWILVLITAGMFVLANVGQAQPPVKPGPVPPGQPPNQPFPIPKSPTAPPVTERRPPAPEYAIAVISTFLVLIIVCMPSRKGV